MITSLQNIFNLKPSIYCPDVPIYVYSNGIRHIRNVLFDGNSLILNIPLKLRRVSRNPSGRSFFNVDNEQIALLEKLVVIMEKSIGRRLSKGFYINKNTNSIFIDMQGIDEYMLTTVNTTDGEELSIDSWDTLIDMSCVASVGITGIKFDTLKSTTKLVTELVNIEVDNSNVPNGRIVNRFNYNECMSVSTLLDSVYLDRHLISKILEIYNKSIIVNRIVVYCDTVNVNYLLSYTFDTESDTTILENDFEKVEELVRDDPWGKGYVYLVTPLKYKGLEVFKVGMTQDNPMNLNKRYKVGCFFHVILPVTSARNTETMLLRLFKCKYENLWGREYFTGNLKAIIYDMIKVTGCFRRKL